MIADNNSFKRIKSNQIKKKVLAKNMWKLTLSVCVCMMKPVMKVRDFCELHWPVNNEGHLLLVAFKEKLKLIDCRKP